MKYDIQNILILGFFDHFCAIDATVKIFFWVQILIQIQNTRIIQLKNVNFEKFHIRWSNPPFRTVHREMTIIWLRNLSWNRFMAFWVQILIQIQNSRIIQLKTVNFENFHIRWSNPTFGTVHREMTIIWLRNLS